MYLCSKDRSDDVDAAAGSRWEATSAASVSVVADVAPAIALALALAVVVVVAAVAVVVAADARAIFDRDVPAGSGPHPRFLPFLSMFHT
jgi:hypothetical protein